MVSRTVGRGRFPSIAVIVVMAFACFGSNTVLAADQPPQITSYDEAYFHVGVPYAFTVTTTGTPTPTITESGAIPAGITFVDNGDGTATIGGTAQSGNEGHHHITLTAANGILPDATQDFDVQVGFFGIDSPNFTTFFESVAGSFTVKAENFCGGTATWSETGSLPSGVTFLGDSATAATQHPTATLAGTPDPGTAGTWPITISGTQGFCSANQSFTLTVLRGSAAYTAVTPVRVLNTRNGTGAPKARLGAGATINLTVTGAPPLAPAGAIAVVLNVTVTNNTTGSFLTVFPNGTTRPVASNLNWTAGTTIANLVEVPVGTGGAVRFYNASGLTDVIADLEGYFAPPSGSAGGQVALTPARITDTRTGSGQPNAGNHLAPNSMLAIQVTGAGGVPVSGVSGAILNVTVTHTTATSFLTVWPAGGSRPNASNLNWTAGVTIPNRVFVPVGSGGMVDVYNASGTADVIVDVSGYFTDGTASGRFFTPQNPVRILDTRPGSPVGPNATRVLQIGGMASVPRFATAVVLNVTVTNTSAGGFLTVHPSTTTRPVASDLNWSAHKTIPNLVVATLGDTGAISLYNSAGTTDVLVDLLGYFGFAPPALVINEFETQGPGGGSDCFVEILNPTAGAAWFAGWTLVYRAQGGTVDTLLATVPAGTAIAAGGYFLFTGSAFANSIPPGVGSMTLPCSMSLTAAGLGLRLPDGTLMDSVGYGTATNGFVETTAVGAPATTKSDSRSPNGTDTNNNSTDFAVSTTISPGATN